MVVWNRWYLLAVHLLNNVPGVGIYVNGPAIYLGVYVNFQMLRPDICLSPLNLHLETLPGFSMGPTIDTTSFYQPSR